MPYQGRMTLDQNSALISPDELDQIILNGENIIILDATYGLPGHPQTTQMRFEQKHIPGAQFFDIDYVADRDKPIPHTIPSEKDFESHARAFGIDKDSLVIVYDQTGFWMAAARVWWMFRLFGHDNVRVLNGGLHAWESHCHDTVTGPAQQHEQGNFKAKYQPHLFKSYNDIRENVTKGDFSLLDARSANAFEQGHIETAVCAPFPELINQASGTLKPKKDLKTILSPFINDNKPIVTSCGSGVTACVTALALYEIGIQDVAVYGGSWADWSSRR